MTTDDAELASEPETTAVDTVIAEHPEWAWSAGDEQETIIERQSWVDTWGIAASVLVLAVVAAIVVCVVHAMGSHTNAQVSTPSVTSTPTWRSIAQPPVPTATTTVTAPPVTVTPTAEPTTPALSHDDATFLRLIAESEHPWVGTDQADTIMLGHRVCTMLGDPSRPDGYQIVNRLTTERAVSFETANSLVSAAIVAYCAQLGGH
jgi:hypothetical protein